MEGECCERCLNKAVPLYRSPTLWKTHTWYLTECLLVLAVRKASGIFFKFVLRIVSKECVWSHFVLSWSSCHRAIRLETLSHSLGANGQGDKIQAIPLTGYHVTVTSAIFVFCSQPPGFYWCLWAQMLIWSGSCNTVWLQFRYHITYIGKMSYPALIPHVKPSDAAPPLYVTGQLTPRRLVCSMTGWEIQTEIHLKRQKKH